MWHEVDADGLTREELLNLYRIIDQRERAFREDLFRFTNFYSAVCYALLAVTLSGFLSLYGKGYIVLALAIGPVITLGMCFLGFRVTTRIYRRTVEEISIKAKLENLLGFDRPLHVAKFWGEKIVWEGDECLLPPRHAKRRFKNDTCEEFITTASRSGFYRDNKVYFGLIALFSILLTIAIASAGIWQMLSH